MKLFIKTFLPSKPKKLFNLTRALSCLEADLQMLLICKLNLSWSSMWRSVWTKSLHLIYLIIISRWLIIQWKLGKISIVWDYLLQSLKLQGVASILQGVLSTRAYHLILRKLILSIFLRKKFLNSLNNIFQVSSFEVYDLLFFVTISKFCQFYILNFLLVAICRLFNSCINCQHFSGPSCHSAILVDQTCIIYRLKEKSFKSS